MGSSIDGKKLTPIVFLNTSAFLLQTFHTFEEMCGMLNFAGDLRIFISVNRSKTPSG
jgi:hypothetical protein